MVAISILQSNGFYPIKTTMFYNLHLFNDNIILIFVWWTNQIKVQLHGYWLPIARFKSNSSPNSKVKILSFFLLRVWALAWRWHGTGRALLAILGRFGHLWLGPASQRPAYQSCFVYLQLTWILSQYFGHKHLSLALDYSSPWIRISKIDVIIL